MQSSTERFTLNPQARGQCVQLNGDKFRIRLTGKGKKKKPNSKHFLLGRQNNS